MYITPKYIKELYKKGKSPCFCRLFEYPEKTRIKQQELIWLLQDAWKFGIKAVGKPQKIFYYEYIQSLGNNMEFFNINFVEVGNIKFCFAHGYYIVIKVKIDNDWINIHDGKDGWLYPIKTKAIQEVLRFLKALADTVDIGKDKEYRKEKADKKAENNRKFMEYMKRKNDLENFEIKL